MKKHEHLREQRAAELEAAQAIVDQADKDDDGNPLLTTEQLEEVEGHTTRASELEQQAVEAEAAEKRARAMAER